MDGACGAVPVAGNRAGCIFLSPAGRHPQARREPAGGSTRSSQDLRPGVRRAFTGTGWMRRRQDGQTDSLDARAHLCDMAELRYAARHLQQFDPRVASPAQRQVVPGAARETLTGAVRSSSSPRCRSPMPREPGRAASASSTSRRTSHGDSLTARPAIRMKRRPRDPPTASRLRVRRRWTASVSHATTGTATRSSPARRSGAPAARSAAQPSCPPCRPAPSIRRWSSPCWIPRRQ